jgi:class 3 adenylate cyclase
VLPLVATFGGRIIDTAGDGILAEFPSVIAAVECATDIQVRMARVKTLRQAVEATANSGVSPRALCRAAHSAHHDWRECHEKHCRIRIAPRGCYLFWWLGP